MRSLVVRSIAAFMLASIGAFVGVFAGLIVGTVIDTALNAPLGHVAVAIPAGTDGRLAIGIAALGMAGGAALFSLAPNVLGGAGARPLRALIGALAGAALYALLREDGAWIHPTLALVPLGASAAASVARPDFAARG